MRDKQKQSFIHPLFKRSCYEELIKIQRQGSKEVVPEGIIDKRINGQNSKLLKKYELKKKKFSAEMQGFEYRNLKLKQDIDALQKEEIKLKDKVRAYQSIINSILRNQRRENRNPLLKD